MYEYVRVLKEGLDREEERERERERKRKTLSRDVNARRGERELESVNYSHEKED